MPSEPVESASTPAVPRLAIPRGRPKLVIVLIALAIVATVIGWAGLDAWCYQNVSRVLYTENALDRDFYTRTQVYVWNPARFPGTLAGGLAAIFGVWAMHPLGWRALVFAVPTVLSTDIVGSLLQRGIGRIRPDRASSALEFIGPRALLDLKPMVCYPSGEAVAAFALATVLSCLYPRLSVLWYGWAIMTAAARIVAAAHYFSDVVVGAVLGILVARAIYIAMARRQDRILAALPSLQRHHQ